MSKKEKSYLTGKEIRAIAKENAKTIKRLEAYKNRKADESEFFINMYCGVVCRNNGIELHKFETKLNRRLTRFGIYVEIKDDNYVRPIINHLKEKYDASSIQVTAPRSGKASNVGIEANIHNPKNKMTPCEISMELEKDLDYVVFAIESI